MGGSDTPNGDKKATPAHQFSIHAACAGLDGAAVLLTGPPGIGKSDLLLRLIDAGFALVADDRVELRGIWAEPPANLAGLLEIRGLGILRLPYEAPLPVRLHVELGDFPDAPRLPPQRLHAATGAWSLCLNPRHAGAISVIRAALRCLSGAYALVAGVNGGDCPILPFPYGIERD